MVLLAASEPAVPWLLKIVLDEGFIGGNEGMRLLVPVMFVGLFLVRGVLGYAGTVGLHWVAHRVVMTLRTAMFTRLLDLPTRYYDRSTAGQLISKLTFDVTQVQQAATVVFTVLLEDSIRIIALISIMFYVQWRLAIIIVLLAPLIGYLIYSISHRLRTMSRRVQESMGEITHISQEAIEGHKAVKIYAGQTYEAERYTRAANHIRQFTMKLVTASALNVPLIQLILAIGLAFTIYLALSLGATEELTPGSFVMFMTIAVLLQAPSKRLTRINEHLQRGVAAAESVFAVIDELEESDEGLEDMERAQGHVSFEAVSFRYADGLMPALSDVSLDVAAGETVALVGASGSGKTTLVNMLPRFYQPSSGMVCLDGSSVLALKLSALRRQIALVSQEVVLFNDTLGNNIAYGAMRGSDEAQITAAAEAAHVMEFAVTLPHGLDTVIGESGVHLSGGQRQRVAIARALLKDAPVLVLDEATSSLDTLSERHIQEALETLRKGRTCLIIAHRLSTVENADRIVVMDSGKIVESGTHQTLLAQGGVYTRLYRHDLEES
jgi:subfamily B ATP-binding cassette protein MsbA